MDRELVRKSVEEVARRVGRRIRDELLSPARAEFSRKGPRDLVTEIDVWAEGEIVAFVNERFSDHLVIGEEGAATLVKNRGVSLRELSSEGVCWIVDPIDGTTNFANRIPFVVVSIGVLIDGIREIGVVYDPARDEMFSAMRGSGATLNGRAISTSRTRDLLDAVLATDGDPSPTSGTPRLPWFDEVRAIRRFGSSALEQCWVACGRLDIYYEAGLKPWDVAAGSLIVEEAGGYSQTVEQPDSFNLFGRTFLFCAPDLIDKLRDEQHLIH